MTEDESRRFQELCALIILEKDEAKFSELVQELNVLVDAKQGRLKKESPEAS